MVSRFDWRGLLRKWLFPAYCALLAAAPFVGPEVTLPQREGERYVRRARDPSPCWWVAAAGLAAGSYLSHRLRSRARLVDSGKLVDCEPLPESHCSVRGFADGADTVGAWMAGATMLLPVVSGDVKSLDDAVFYGKIVAPMAVASGCLVHQLLSHLSFFRRPYLGYRKRVRDDRAYAIVMSEREHPSMYESAISYWKTRSIPRMLDVLRRYVEYMDRSWEARWQPLVSPLYSLVVGHREDWKGVTGFLGKVRSGDIEGSLEWLLGKHRSESDLSYKALGAYLMSLAGRKERHVLWREVADEVSRLGLFKTVRGGTAEVGLVEVPGVLSDLLVVKRSADVAAQHRQYGELERLCRVDRDAVPHPLALFEDGGFSYQVMARSRGRVACVEDVARVGEAYASVFPKVRVDGSVPCAPCGAWLGAAASRTPWPSSLGGEVAKLNEDLAARLSSAPTAYCHGDLHRGNVLVDEARVMFIDPLPVIGPAELDGALLSASVGERYAASDVGVLSEALQLQRLLGWSYAFGDGDKAALWSQLGASLDDASQVRDFSGARSLARACREWKAWQR